MAVAAPVVSRAVRAGALPAVALGAGLVLAGHLLGARLEAADPLVHVGAPPLVGSFDVQVGARLLLPGVLAGAAVACGPALALRLTWRALLGATWGLAAAWAAALGWSTSGSPAAPLRSRYELLTAVPAAHDAGRFLRGFTEALPSYATHVRGHPPGGVLLLSGLDRVGLGGAGWAAALCIAAGAAAAPLALVAARTTGMDARRAAPFLALAPAAVWIATSMDALYLGVGALAVALVALRRPLLGGLAFGSGLMLSYGLAPLGLLLVVVAWPRPRALALVAAGAAAVLGAFALAGFWWVDGLQATHDVAFAGVLTRRPYADFLVIDLAALALALGPAAFAGLRRGGRAPLPAAALVALVVTDLLGVTRGETERVWLLFVPWLLLPATGLGRGWLGAQAALAIALQAGVRSPW